MNRTYSLILILFCLSCSSKNKEQDLSFAKEQIPKSCYQLIACKYAQFLPGLISSWDTLVLKKLSNNKVDTMFSQGLVLRDTNTVHIGRYYDVNFESKDVKELGGMRKIVSKFVTCAKNSNQ
jgi:hypothetical protein